MMTLCNTAAVGRVAGNVPVVEKDLGVFVDSQLNRSQRVPRQPRRPVVSWLVSYTVASRIRAAIMPLYSALDEAAPLIPCSCFGPLNSGRVLRCWNMSREGQQSWWWFWNKSPMRSGWGRQDCSSWKKRGSEGASLLDGCWSLLSGNKW